MNNRGARVTALLLAALCLLSTVATSEARMQLVHKQPHLGLLVKRQAEPSAGGGLLGGPGDPGTQQSSAAPAPAPANPSPSTPTGPVNPITIIPPNSQAGQVSSDPDAAPSSADDPLDILSPPSSSIAPVSSSVEVESSSAPSSSATRTRPASADVINVTSTALINAAQSSVSAANASASSDADKDGGGGLNKTTLIIIIAIGSSVALIAAAWTIFRKWKLSPSRSFEDKLQPIDWSPEMAGAHRSEDKLALTRSDSNGSGTSSLNKNGGSAVGGGGAPGLRRYGSWGSNSERAWGSRNDMSEVPYNPVGPGYPPVTTYPYEQQPAYQQQQSRIVNPYEQLSRAPTGFSQGGGGRYGEGYTRFNY